MPHITFRNIKTEEGKKIWADAKDQLMSICDLPEERFVVDVSGKQPITSSAPLIIDITWIERTHPKQEIVNVLTDACNKHNDMDVRVIFRNMSKGTFFINKEAK